MRTSTGAPLDLENTKCHSLTPCQARGVYLVTYADKNSYGVDGKKGESIGDGLVIYGSCSGHINQMRLGCGDLVYISDKRIGNDS